MHGYLLARSAWSWVAKGIMMKYPQPLFFCKIMKTMLVGAVISFFNSANIFEAIWAVIVILYRILKFLEEITKMAMELANVFGTSTWTSIRWRRSARATPVRLWRTAKVIIRSMLIARFIWAPSNNGTDSTFLEWKFAQEPDETSNSPSSEFKTLSSSSENPSTSKSWLSTSSKQCSLVSLMR